MPNVSPAAGGSRRPATMVGPPYRRRRAGRLPRPSIAPDAERRSPRAAAASNPLGRPTRRRPWSGRRSTPRRRSLARGDTDRPAHGARRADAPGRRAPPRRSGRRERTPQVALRRGRRRCCLVGRVLVGASTSRSSTRPTATAGTARHPATPQRITVSQTGGENTVATLRDALSKAGPGDTIVDRRAETDGAEAHARPGPAQGPHHRVGDRRTASRRSSRPAARRRVDARRDRASRGCSCGTSSSTARAWPRSACRSAARAAGSIDRGRHRPRREDGRRSGSRTRPATRRPICSTGPRAPHGPDADRASGLARPTSTRAG